MDTVRILPKRFCAFVNYDKHESAAVALENLQVRGLFIFVKGTHLSFSVAIWNSEIMDKRNYWLYQYFNPLTPEPVKSSVVRVKFIIKVSLLRVDG